MGIHKALITRIENLLAEKGWLMSELIKRSGVNQSTIAEIMAGRSTFPRIKTIDQIAYGFGMSLSEFFDDELFKNGQYRQK